MNPVSSPLDELAACLSAPNAAVDSGRRPAGWGPSHDRDEIVLQHFRGLVAIARVSLVIVMPIALTVGILFSSRGKL